MSLLHLFVGTRSSTRHLSFSNIVLIPLIMIYIFERYVLVAKFWRWNYKLVYESTVLNLLINQPSSDRNFF